MSAISSLVYLDLDTLISCTIDLSFVITSGVAVIENSYLLLHNSLL